MSTRVVEREVEVGILKKETINAILMTRKLFLETVDSVLRSYNYPYFEGIRDMIWPIAESIEFFPFSTWIAEGRGCGCLIGEYLMQNDIVDREWGATHRFDIEDTLAPLDYSDTMLMFGNRIDAVLSQLCKAELGIMHDSWQRVLVIVDELPT